MTAGQLPELFQVLTRADRRWAERRADDPAPQDYLRHLEKYVRPLVDENGTSNGDARSSIPDADEANLRAQVANVRAEAERLRTANQELTKELGRVRTDYADAVRCGAELADQLEQMRRERDGLAEQLRVEQPHVCAWPWPDPNGPVLPCVCGRRYPRYLEEVEDDGAPLTVEPWAVVFDRLRVEVADCWPEGG